ncbi:putative MerR family transcriptional regulator [Gordonia effusa NBRC 100432]|uniref:Putative MerR family transcriptional regulator n=1 Tax=Gordonia effusa NBRC 100432 TaxID=1077974 RepID=H0R317_9ACTN|nr:MerR family transcriptional regulator [Gordonia effusa]GAB19468.1 putative MerR family transcriptional regulator [Gordonia effusa NBRC 100432]
MTEYRIDDLARVSGTTTRNIRGYQEQGLLPRPLRRGRIAIYTERHLANLRAINRLLGNGFTLKHIATFLTNPRAPIGEVLDLADLLDKQWAAEPPSSMSVDELEKKLGPLDGSTLADLVRAQILIPTDDPAGYRPIDAHIIGNLGQLIERDMALADLIGIHAEFIDKLDEAAAVFIKAAHDEIIRRRGPGWVPTGDDEIAWATDLLTTMRRTGTQNARAALDRALDQARENEIRVHEVAARRHSDRTET